MVARSDDRVSDPDHRAAHPPAPGGVRPRRLLRHVRATGGARFPAPAGHLLPRRCVDRHGQVAGAMGAPRLRSLGGRGAGNRPVGGQRRPAPPRISGLAGPRGRLDAPSDLVGKGLCHRGRCCLDRLRLRGDRCGRGVQCDPALQCSIPGRCPPPGTDLDRGAAAVHLPRVASRDLEAGARRLAAGGIPGGQRRRTWSLLS